MIILHGENITDSRQRLIELIAAAKLKDKEVIQLNMDTISLTLLKQSIESGSMFGQDRTIVIEGFGQLSEEIKKYLGLHIDKDIIVWEGKNLTIAQVKSLGKSSIVEFKLPQLLFTFLDGIGVGNPLNMIQLLEKLLKQQNPDMVFALYHRRLRQLLLVKMGDQEILSSEKINGWQLSKLNSQVRNMTREKIIGKYKECFQYDLNRKSGKTFIEVDKQLLRWMINW